MRGRHFVFTGFGPFADVAYNPSWDCALAAAETSEGHAELLDVTIGAAEDAAERLADADVLVQFGVAVARNEVCLERFAHNWWQDYGDAHPCRLLEGGAVAFESPLPLDRWALELDGAGGFSWVVSHDAGTYVCNAAFYHALSRGRTAVFVHVPDCTPAKATQIGAALGRYLATR